MSGRAELPANQPINPRIFTFGNDYHWKIAVEPVDDSTGQVDAVSAEPDPGFGPSVVFATTVLEKKPDMVIGLIPCAIGGSTIQEWQRNLSDRTLYGSCLKRIRAASVMGQVAGVLFFQGETDADDPALYPETVFSPNEWSIKFLKFINDLRNDLNIYDLPIVFAEIGTNTDPKRSINWQIVQQQQQMTTAHCLAMITTRDLSLQDFVHFNTESQRIIGQRFAKAFLDLSFCNQK